MGRGERGHRLPPPQRRRLGTPHGRPDARRLPHPGPPPRLHHRRHRARCSPTPASAANCSPGTANPTACTATGTATTNCPPAGAPNLCGPVLARLRSVLARRFARDLLACPAATINLTDVLDGGILIARLPKGQIGEDTARLIGSLLLSGLWSAATRRSALPPEQRLDATIIVDECHNFLHLPVGMDDALAEARGYRISLVLAHQHLAQLPADVAHAVDANARNKIYFTVSPDDARHLARHTAPVFDDYDLAARPGFHASVRVLHHGQAVPAFSLATVPLPDPPPGRDALIRRAARANAGLTLQQRRHAHHRQLMATPDTPVASGG